MSCRRYSFETFLVFYVLSSVFLTIAAVNLQVDKRSYLSQQGLNYIYAMLGWMFVTILFYLVSYIRLFLLFPLPIVLLIIGIVVELLGVALLDLQIDNSSLVVLGVVTGYFVPLQIIGVLLSIVYVRRNQVDCHAPPSKEVFDLLL